MSQQLRNGFSPFVQNLLDDLNWVIGPIFLVGGGLRDSLRHQYTAHELDIMVTKPLDQCNQQLLEAGYHAVIKGHRPNTLILPLKRKDPPSTLHIGCCCGGEAKNRNIEDDLRHRDITINAMALPWPDGELVDPFGGQQDLQENIIRLVNGEQTIQEDPIRALRFFRFTIQLAGEPAPKDLELAGNASLYRADPERLRGETDRIFSLPLRDERSKKLIFELFKTPLGKDLLPEFSPLKAFPERADHLQTVWENSLLTMLQLSTPTAKEEVSLLDLRWAALLHQLGKPVAARWDSEGRVCGYGTHRDHSVRRCLRVLQRLAFTKRRQRRIIGMIQYMEIPFPPTEKMLKRILQQRVPAEGVFRLLRAKMEASANSDQERSEVHEEFQKVIRRCQHLRDRMYTLHPEELALSGGDLIDLARMDPGPWVGELQGHLLRWISEDPKRNQPDPLTDEVRNWLIHQNDLCQLNNGI
uniref:Putative tRNA nucleotidyltransferase/poly(A) polymerase n=1 Tax=Magnetococcus massalia (strain MO-1) TaxID=451514 RepID=A0A1S7LFH4_MAGMO|nr:Putative tRNA nucleotidyltransferase/poly(A) polymerase [Candidatus Magnetococcus massalia]